MWKCSFVRVACVVLASCWLQTSSLAQEYSVDEPNDGPIVLASVASADVSLIFDQSEIVVNPGDQLDLDCGVQGNIRYCIWEAEDETTYQVEDVHANFFPGMSAPANLEGNECGIVINKATIEHHGLWTCKVFIPGDSLTGSKNVIVTIKPTSPVLEVETLDGHLQVSNEIESAVKCSVAAARPAVGLRWYLGEEDITVHAETEEKPTDKGGIYKSVSTLRRQFQPTENGKGLICSVTHQTLPVPENASIPLNVVFKPVEKPISTYYQIAPGNDYEVRLNFSANPEATKREWRYGDSFQNIAASIPIPGEDGRYRTNIESLGNGLYTATLYIVGFTEADANQRYLLVVENDYGETQFKVKLSMDEAPTDTMGGGAVAAIVILVLLIVAALGAAGYARYRQMFCFAAEYGFNTPVVAPDPEEGKDTKEEHSDTESARGTNTNRAANIKNSLGKLTQVFMKPKKQEETKLEETVLGDEENKFLTSDDEVKKDVPDKEQSPTEKEVSLGTIIPEENVPNNTYSEEKSDSRNEHTEEKKVPETTAPQHINNEKKSPEEKKEVVYAELDLGKGDSDKKTEVKTDDKTEYAQIVGTVTDNKEEEKKE